MSVNGSSTTAGGVPGGGSGGAQRSTMFTPSQRRRQDDERFNLSPQQCDPDLNQHSELFPYSQPVYGGFRVLGLTKGAAQAHSQTESARYLERYHIQTYMADAVRMVLDSRDERPLEATLKYFHSVLQGSHVALREFEYVNSTPRNRMSFVRIFVEDNRSVPPDSETTVDDHLQLVTLLCADFPPDIHQEVARLMTVNGETTLRFGQVSAYFQVLFVFAEFIAAVRRVLSGPSAEGGSMDRTNFLWAVRNIVNTKHWHFSCPAASLLEQIIAAGLDVGGEKRDVITLPQFAAGMVQCDALVLSPKPAAGEGAPRS